MGKGVLLEMGGREAVVLTPQGEFKTVPVPKGTWDIGDEIEYAETPQQSYWHRWGLAAAAAAIMLLAPIGWAGYQQYQLSLPAAIVTMDINPSLELTLNKADDVLSARGLNADGTTLLQHISVKGRPPLDQVVEAATQAAVDMNKLDPTDPTSAVLVAVAPTGDKALPVAKAETLREKAKDAVAAQVTQVAKQKGAEPKTTVAGVVATPAEKKAAEAAGVSPGKYTFYEELQQVAPQVNLEDVKNAGPGKLLKNLNINPGDFFSKAEEKHGADDQKKVKSEPKSEEKSQEQATPANGKPEDKQPGNGKAEDKKEQKQEEKGNAPAEPKKDEKQQEQHGNSKSNGVQQQENKGNAKDIQKGESGNKGEPKKQESPGQKENGNDKKSSWTIPFLGITIEKPSFLQGKSETATEPAAPVVATPRADQPGAGAPVDKRSDQQQSDQKQSDQKQADQKQSDQKQSDQKQSDQKQSEKQSDKGASKEQDKNNGKDQSNKDSGKSNGKDKGD